MPLADSQYHVKLNGKGYLLVEGSRRKRAQQPFYPRFSTGEYGLTDLSFWQFQGHDAFDGGQGQNETFLTKNQIKGSTGWDFRDGKARLSLGLSNYGFGDSTATDTPAQAAAASLTARVKMLAFGNDGPLGTGASYMVILTPGVGTVGTMKWIGKSTDDPYIFQARGDDAFIWSRGQLGTFICVADNANNNLYVYLLVGPAQDMTADHTIAGIGHIAYPIDGDTLLTITNATPGGAPVASVQKWTANAWTQASSLASSIATGSPLRNGMLAIDANGTIYVAGAGGVTGSVSSRVIAFTSADLLATNGPRESAIYELNGFVIGGLHWVNGVLYAMGAAIKKGYSTNGAGPATYGAMQQQIVNVLNGDVIWESPYSYADGTLDNVILTTFQGNPTEAYFIARNYLSSYDGVFRLAGSGQVDEVLALPRDANGSKNWLGLCVTGNRIYVYNRSSNKFLSSNITRGALDSTGVKAILETSELTGNMPLIKKAPYSVLIELSQALSGGDVLTVVLNGTTLGTIAAADGTSKEITVPSDLTGTKFNIQIQAAYTVQWDGYIRRLLLKYIPVQVKKKVFGFGIRATRALRLIDGSAETRDPKTELSDLWAAWASNTPVTFVDIDGTSYTVVITDLDERTDLLNPANGNEIEALAFFEALEV